MYGKIAALVAIRTYKVRSVAAAAAPRMRDYSLGGDGGVTAAPRSRRRSTLGRRLLFGAAKKISRSLSMR